ncbi:SIS domain-containing protein [Streptomyces sp. NPDC003077]|uniref:SIS domain-containing protein n=1 Tax=Streptomyces sp. NPDC003077 TaxID=3154443 RepID=UPI0033A653A4
MSGPVLDEAAARHAFARREEGVRGLADAAGPLVAACREMAARFARGGKLLVFGNGESGADASHVAVEFMHPVVVGKRALPALALGNDAATVSGVGAREGFAEVFAHQLRAFAAAGDVALGISPDGRCPNVRRGMAVARELGLLTIGLSGGDPADAADADHVLVVGGTDPLVVKEVHVTAYHLMWEVVQVFLEGTFAGVVGRGGGAPEGGGGPPEEGAVPPECAGGVCVTCSDEAVPMRVRRLLPGDLAEAEGGGTTRRISVALVAAAPGTTVLVHAGEAIGVVGGDGEDPGAPPPVPLPASVPHAPQPPIGDPDD